MSEIIFGRRENFDVRSRNFSIGEAVKDKKLRSYSWRCSETLDQGNEGACVAYALGHELIARPSEVKGLTDKWLKEEVYWEAQRRDPWEGGAYPGASPAYDGTSVLSGIKVIQDKGYIGEYRWAFNFDDLVLGVGHNGPAVLGLYWYEGMFHPDAKGFIKPTGRILGGHAVLARAVNIKKEVITIRNSWGFNWGQGGDCFITFEDLDNLLYQNGEAAFLMKRKTVVSN